MDEDDICRRIEPEPFDPEPFPDGKTEVHKDGGGLTNWRLMTRAELAEQFPLTQDEMRYLYADGSEAGSSMALELTRIFAVAQHQWTEADLVIMRAHQAHALSAQARTAKSPLSLSAKRANNPTLGR